MRIDFKIDIFRRMFPLVKLKLSGLDKNSNYTIIMEMISVDKLRYKFWNGNWIVAGVGEHHPLPTCFVHPQSPRSGEWWMTDGVDFKMAKLSNNPFNNDGHVSFMMKETKIIHLKCSDCTQFNAPL